MPLFQLALKHDSLRVRGAAVRALERLAVEPGSVLRARAFGLLGDHQEPEAWHAALSVLTNVYEPVDLTRVEESAVRAAGIEITVKRRGKSFLADAADRHVDLVNLGSKKLSDLAIMLKASIRANDCRSFTIEELVALLRVAGQARRVVIDSLPNDWKKAVKGG